MSEAALVVEQSARRENLAHFLEFVDDACHRLKADDEAAYAVRLAVEEVCLNLIDYGYAGATPGPIRIEVKREGDVLAVAITDRGAPFHPDQAPAPDLSSEVEQRPIGGLGWHLVKNMVDQLAYRTDAARGNQLTFTKRSTLKEGISNGIVR